MVFIKALNKNIYPLYLAPKKEELFSSWLCRLSVNHELKPQSFSTNYFGRNLPIWNRDIDLNPPEKLINKIIKHTPLNRESVEQLFLKSYSSFSFEEKGLKGGSTSNIMSLGINHRKRNRYGLSFCSSCLNKSPHYKKSWRLITSILCVECNQYLQDRCPNCSSPVVFHRVNISNNNSSMNFKPINKCHNCNYNLAKKSKENTPSSIEIEYQTYINNTIKNGYNDLTNYSFSYIKTFLQLSKRSRTTSKNDRFRSTILKYTKFNLEITKTEVRFWSVLERKETFPYIYLILKDKNKAKKMFRLNKVRKSYISPDQNFPYWFFEYFDY